MRNATPAPLAAVALSAASVLWLCLPAAGSLSGVAGAQVPARTSFVPPPTSPGRTSCGPTATTATTATTVTAPWPAFGGSGTHPQSGVSVSRPAGDLHRRWETPPLDATMYAEALVTGGCVYVATENDTLYAFQAAGGAMVWRAHLARPVTSGLPCGDISPSGVTGTPVLDPSRDEIWAAVLTQVAGHVEHELFGLDARTGAVLRRQPFALPGEDPAAEQQRGALEVEGGRVYVPLGGLYGDCGAYKGAVVSIPETPGQAMAYWHTPTAREGAVWEVGGPDILANGDLLLATGNGAASAGQPFDGSDAVVELSAGLHMQGYFAPKNWAAWSAADLDIGSTGPALLPSGLAFQVGKAGEGFLVSTSHLGGIGGQLSSLQVCSGDGAYGADAVAGTTVYVPCSGGLAAVKVVGHGLRLLWRSGAGGTGSPLVAGGRLFEQAQGGSLVAFDPANGKVLQTLSLSSPSTHFPWLVSVGTELFAANGTSLEAFGGI